MEVFITNKDIYLQLNQIELDDALLGNYYIHYRFYIIVYLVK